MLAKKVQKYVCAGVKCRVSYLRQSIVSLALPADYIGLHLCLAPHMHVHTNHLQNVSRMRIRFYGNHVYGTATNPRTHGIVTVLAWIENSFGVSCKRDKILRQEIHRDARFSIYPFPAQILTFRMKTRCRKNSLHDGADISLILAGNHSSLLISSRG
jgi:hypothetical protein